MRAGFAWLLGCGLAFSSGNGEFRFPALLRDVDGSAVRVDSLARARKLVLVTVKAPWCPVCREQLRRLRERRKEAAACGATFMVLSPGPAEDVAALRRETGFFYPFVEDSGLGLASRLGLQLSQGEIQPALMLLDGDRRVRWMQAGRGAGHFGDEDLFAELGCADWI